MAYALGYAGGYGDLGVEPPPPIPEIQAGGRARGYSEMVRRRKVTISQRLTWTVRAPVRAEARLAWMVTPKKEPVALVAELRWRAHRETEELWLLGVTEAP